MFLTAICDWPTSLFDCDILFLLPLPWWGPVLAPVCVAVLMILWGMLVCHTTDGNRRASIASTRLLGWIGMALALYVFMADALHVVHHGVDATRTVLPK